MKSAALMKLIHTILLVSSFMASGLLAQPVTSEAFVSEVRAAWEQQDGAKVDALTYSEGASDADKAMMAKWRFAARGEEKVQGVSLTPMREDYEPVWVAKGKKYELTHAPAGFVKIDITRSKFGNGSSSINMPYAVIGGKYFLVGTKSTDLGWKGPDDKPLGFSVTGRGSNDVVVEYGWNASGVDLAKKTTSNNRTFLGQHINFVKVTSTNPAAEITLKLEKNNETFHTSQPLKGAGALEYKKPD